MSDEGSVLDRYTKPEEEPLENAGKYRAYGVDKANSRTPMLWVEYGNGEIELFNKSYLVRVLMSSHQRISLIFSDCALTLKGQRLRPIMVKLLKAEILSLHCYRPGVDTMPEASEALITEIVYMTLQEMAAQR